MSDSDRSINVAIYWHMHQPEYRDLRNGEYHQPWTYLHTIKDYVDMAAHLENTPQAKAVVNFAPVLLEQIDDYAKQLDAYLNQGEKIRDPLLSTLAEPVMSLDEASRMHIIESCLRANRQRLIERYESYTTLAEMAETAILQREKLAYYSEQFFTDLLMWYHLAWMGETVRLTDDRVQYLMKKKHNFTLHDRHSLIELICEIISSVIPR